MTGHKAQLYCSLVSCAGQTRTSYRCAYNYESVQLRVTEHEGRASFFFTTTKERSLFPHVSTVEVIVFFFFK